MLIQFFALSLVLLADPAPKPPGVVIDFNPTKTKAYIGSPSIAVLPNGDYVASHDFFGPGTKFDTSVLFGSKDKGKTWSKKATLVGQWWSTLFVHEGALYMIGTTKEYGFTVIRSSKDGGTTWTEPKDADSGLLLGDGMYHCAPVPVVVHNGRLWRGMEQYLGPKWGAFQAFMMSAPVGADLLKASSWTSTNRLDRDAKWLDGKFAAWLEGNAVVTPAGELVDILRVQVPNYPEVAAIVRISPDGKTASFDVAKDVVPFTGGAKKFAIRYDEESKQYWALANHVPEAFQKPPVVPGSTRNTLALLKSNDLKTWTVVRELLSHPDVKQHGFQYPDFLFEGTDIIAVVRTAWDEPDGTQARNAHDANHLTFHRFENFRK